MAGLVYPNPDLLVEGDWLAEHLHDAKIRIVDADERIAYRRAHIPGAVGHIGHMYLKEREGATHIMGPDQFASTMGRMGIGDDTLVIAYDASNSLYATRLWWCLNYYGHSNVRVLNGGFNKWVAENRPISLASRKPSPAEFTPQVRPEWLGVCEVMKAGVSDPDTVFLDVRSDEEYAGVNTRGNSRRGHIPGAVHLEWLNFISDGLRTFKAPEVLSKMLTERGVTPDKNVYTY